MRILWENKILSSDLTASSENPDFTIDNVQDTRLAVVYRSVEESTNITITGPITASYFSILNHNLTESATVTLEGNNTDSWGAPSFSQSVDWLETSMIVNFSESTYNYWRLIIVDDDTGADGYIEIGSLYLGTYLQMPGMEIGQEIPQVSTSTKQYSSNGQVYGDKKIIYRNPKIDFPYITELQRTEIKEMWENNENTGPVIVLIWANRLDIEPLIYSVIDQDSVSFTKSQNKNVPYKTSLQFREVF